MAGPVLRRGLPRVKGGDPWLPATASVPSAVPSAAASEQQAPAASSVSAPRPDQHVRLRRGLPRVAGGDAWPPAGSAPTAPATPVPGAGSPAGPGATATAPARAAAEPGAGGTPSPGQTSAPAERGEDVTSAGVSLRRGLPREKGGEAWPPAGLVAAAGADSDAPVPAVTGLAAVDAPTPGAVRSDLSVPLVSRRSVWPGTAPRHGLPEPETSGFRLTWPRAAAALFGAAGLGVLALSAIAFVRAFLSLPFMRDFLAAFPGEYEPAISVEPGFSPWVGWQHFFNMFLIVLIIRSGLTVRTEKRPTVFWIPRGDPKGKISLTLWLHQALDVLWLVNGVVFVVLLFVTGHWVRIVPTSWEVVPHAVSAALQYASFDWPAENGWNNYNALQQLAYFVTVFVAAPLAAVTGYRMSGMWPKRAVRLSKAYPVEWARAVHFPVMLYFVAFIVVHVALVVLTGFIGNLNHMFASQQGDGMLGFWLFVAAVAAIVIGWLAARPVVVAPIAKLFGQVSGR